MYGCDRYGYDHDNLIGMCTKPERQMVVSALYFIVFIFMGE